MISYNTMSRLVSDAVAGRRQLVVADDWYNVFLKVCIDKDLDYTAEMHEGFRLVSFEY